MDERSERGNPGTRSSRAPILPCRLAVVLFLVVPFLIAVWVVPLGAQTLPDPLEPYRGTQVIIEFPALSDVGDPLPAPNGWRSVQVTAETFDAFVERMPPGETLGLLLFDEHGNLAERVAGSGARGKLARAVREAEAQIERWRKRLAKDTVAHREARTEGEDGEELELLVGIRDSGLRGYPEISEAQRRLDELETERTRAMWHILALEGLTSPRTLGRALEDLHRRSEGLAIATVIAEEAARVSAGRVVHARRDSPKERERE